MFPIIIEKNAHSFRCIFDNRFQNGRIYQADFFDNDVVLYFLESIGLVKVNLSFKIALKEGIRRPWWPSVLLWFPVLCVPLLHLVPEITDVQSVFNQNTPESIVLFIDTSINMEMCLIKHDQVREKCLIVCQYQKCTCKVLSLLVIYKL